MYAGAAFVYRGVCGETSDGVPDAAGIGEQVESAVAVEGCGGLLYYFVAEEVRRELPDLSLVAGKEHLLEDLGVGAGEMFVALQGHLVPTHGKVPTIFLLLPTAGGEFAKIIVEAVADPVV